MTGSRPVIRVGTAADAAAVARVVNAAYRHGGDRAWTTEASLVGGPRVTEAGYREILARPRSVVLVAEGERIVGCVHIEARDEVCHLGMLSVDPSEQASGLGRRLLAEAETEARSRFGTRVMEMHVVSVRPELIAWYERRGYRRTGKRIPFEGGENVTFLRGPLEFVLLEKTLA